MCLSDRTETWENQLREVGEYTIGRLKTRDDSWDSGVAKNDLVVRKGGI